MVLSARFRPVPPVVGNIVEIRPGDRIPLDGVVVEGESRIDTSPITGEPVPVSVKVGSHADIRLRQYFRSLKDESREGNFPSPWSQESSIPWRTPQPASQQAERFITKFARVYTPFVVALAAATAIIPSLITGNLVPLDLHSSYLPRNQLPVCP